MLNAQSYGWHSVSYRVIVETARDEKEERAVKLNDPLSRDVANSLFAGVLAGEMIKYSESFVHLRATLCRRYKSLIEKRNE
jgi:sensor histidine kinase regulating citrate/malate metabolism